MAKAVRRPPKGHHDGSGIKLAVKFTPKLFKRINERATKHNKNFSEIVNETCECGLLCLEESERDEPNYKTVVSQHEDRA
jgi:hypothetical protein